MKPRKYQAVADFFDIYPIPRNDVARFAAETGYTAQTVASWMGGRVRPSKAGFDCLVAAYVRPRYVVDEDFLNEARNVCSDRTTYTQRRAFNLAVAAEDAAPVAPVAPAGDAEDVANVELDATFYLLKVTLRNTPMTGEQRLDLIRELCG